MWNFLCEINSFFVEFVDRLSDSGVSTEGPPQIFPFWLVIAMKNNLLLFLTIREHAFSLVKSYVLFFKNSEDLVHLISVLEVKEEAPFGVDKISGEVFGDESEWEFVLQCDTIFESECVMIRPVHIFAFEVCAPSDIIIFDTALF